MYTKEFLITKLQEATALLGRSPSGRELDSNPSFPSRNSYRNHFGTLEKAKKVAGVPPGLRGTHHPYIWAALINLGYIKKDPNKVPNCSTLLSPKQQRKRRNRHYGALSLRFKVLHRDKFTCQYCGRTPQDGVKLEVDHINPKSKGGKFTMANLITACFECNKGKFTMHLLCKPKTPLE